MTAPDPAAATDALPRVTAARRWLAGGLATGLVAAVAVTELIRWGTPPTDIVVYALFLVWGVCLPGFVVHRSLRGPQPGWPHEIALAATTGLIGVFGAAVIGAASGIGAWALWLWPPVTLLLLLPVGTRRRVLARTSGASWGPGAALGVAASVAALVLHVSRSFFAVSPLPPSDVPLYQDLLWHLGLIGEATRSIPLQTPQAITAGPVRYHWFADAEIAGESLATGLDPVVLLLRLWPLVLAVLVVLLAAVLAHSASRRSAAAPLAAGLTAATTILLPWAGPGDAQDAFRPLSPTQLFAMAILLLALHAAFEWCGTSGPPGAGVVAVAAAITGAGAKPTVLPLLLGGFVVAAIASRFLRARVRPWLVGAAASAVLLVASLILVAGGDSGSSIRLLASLALVPLFVERLTGGQGLVDPGFVSGPGVFAAAVAIAAMWAVRPLLGVAPIFQAELRRRPGAWMLAGACGAGVAAFLVLGHPGYSQLYFLHTAIPVGAVAGAWWLVAAVGDRPWAVRVAAIAGLAGAAAAALAYWWRVARESTGTEPAGLRSAAIAAAVIAVAIAGIGIAEWVRRRRGGRRDGPALIGGLAALVGAILASLPLSAFVFTPPPPATSSLALAQSEAAEWIREHTPADALLAVNDHCLGEESATCNARVFWASGLAQRRVLVEAWSYTAQSSGDRAYFDPALLEFNQALFEEPTPALASEASEKGVGWLVATLDAGPVSSRLDEIADRVYANDEIEVYRLR